MSAARPATRVSPNGTDYRYLGLCRVALAIQQTDAGQQQQEGQHKIIGTGSGQNPGISWPRMWCWRRSGSVAGRRCLGMPWVARRSSAPGRSGAAARRVHREAPGRVPRHAVLRAVPGMAGSTGPDGEAGPPHRRQGVCRLLGGQAAHRRSPYRRRPSSCSSACSGRRTTRSRRRP